MNSAPSALILLQLCPQRSRMEKAEQRPILLDLEGALVPDDDAG
jgi:hypothetical protein